MHTLTLRVRESFWFIPTVAGVLAIVLAEALVLLDQTVQGAGVRIALLDQLSASGGRSILTTIGTAMLTVAGTSFSITISVLATTSSTYGPRLVRNFMADRANQAVLAAFTSTFLYTMVVVRSVHTAVDDGTAFVPVIAVHVAVLVGVLDVGVLVFFIHHIASSVQITSLQKQVQVDLLGAVDVAYRTRDDDEVLIGTDAESVPDGGVVVTADRDGYVQSVAWGALVSWAEDNDRVVDVRAMPGDHVVDGDELVRVHAAGDGQRADDLTDRAVARIRAALVIGTARTPHEDVRFALQQLVEIAVRGLASGSNDPYTAVSALDLSATPLVPAWRDRSPVTAYQGRDGAARVLVHWPTLEELVESLFDGVLSYGTDHAIVLRAALRLAHRLEDAADRPSSDGADARVDRRGALDGTVLVLERHLAAADPSGGHC